MTADFCFRIIKFAIKKNMNGDITPQEFMDIMNQAQDSFLDYLLGSFQQYQYSKPQPRVQFGNNESTRQRLVPLIYGYTLTVDGTGLAPYPADYQQVDTMFTSDKVSRIRFCTTDRLYSTNASVIDPVATNPIYIIENIGFRFYPSGISNPRLNYVKAPPKIVWGYDIDSNGREVYNQSKSVDPVFYDIDMYEIIMRALKLVGVSLQLNTIGQLANQVTQQGQ